MKTKAKTTTPPSPDPQQSESRTGPAALLAKPKVIVGALITIAAVWFIIANNERVRIRLWIPWISARLWVVLLLTFLAGALVGFLFARRRQRRDR